jgi:pimeloyl-ACP methyl ester carboxylesterase
VVEIEQITQDAADLIHALQLAPCHFVGLSMGGFVGMRLAARHPELLRSLTLIATAADPEPPENHPRYKTLIQVTRIFGVRAVRRAVMPIMFGKTFLNDPERKPLRKQWSRELVSNRRRAVCAVRGVIERSSVEDELHQIQCPTLILHGAEDAAISVPRVNALHQGIPNAKLVRFATGGHTLTIEEPRQVNAELLRFLEQVS